MSLSAEVLASVVARETGTGDLVVNSRFTKYDFFREFADGTGADQAQVVYSDNRTAASGSFTVLLSAISDTRNGASVLVNFTAVKCIMVKNTHATHTITLSGAFSGVVKPGGVFLLVDPSAAGASPSSLFFETTAGATYDLVVIGEGTVT